MKELAGNAAVGLGFGYALSRIGFSDWGEVHRMFTFADLRLTLGFAGAVALLAAFWPLVRRASREPPVWAPRRLYPGTVPGALLFGAGWAVSGSCPSIALVQLGEGQLGALATRCGIFAGNALYAQAHRLWFRWSVQSCVED
ncbi:MAG: YeeE/YedE family protein [Deltaproteobacteria bacterium]|nr:YeeE/YedE family protein [Deltaproteobacteria bacterium]